MSDNVIILPVVRIDRVNKPVQRLKKRKFTVEPELTPVEWMRLLRLGNGNIPKAIAEIVQKHFRGDADGG